MALSTNKTWRFADSTARTWSTASNWLNVDGTVSTQAPGTTAVVTFNGGNATVAAQTIAGIIINGNTTLGGTGLTVTGAFTVNSGTITIAMTASLNLNGNISNPGGTITHTGAGAITMAGTTSVTADFGSNSLRTLTVAKTSSGGVTFQTSEVNVTGTNSSASVFTFTSGAIIQNVQINCGNVVNTSTTSRIWAMNSDLYITAGGNAIGCGWNHAGSCTLSSRTGTIRINSITNGTNNTVNFPTASPTASAASNAPNVNLESDTLWTITGNINNLTINGRCNGTTSAINVFGTVTTNDGYRTFTSCNPTFYNATNNQTRTLDMGGVGAFGTAVFTCLTSTTCTYNVNSLNAINITCSGINCTYNLGVQDDDSQVVALTSNATLTLSAAGATFNLYNVRSYNTTMSSNYTYNVYHLEHNYFNANPPTAGTTTHSAGTLNIKSGYTLTTYAFTSNTTSGTRTIIFEDNSYITTLNTGPLLMGYTALTGNNAYDSSGFLHQSTGQVTFTGTPGGNQGVNNAFNLWLYKINNSVGVTTVRNLTIVDGAGMTTTATITFCKNFTGYTSQTITGLIVTQSTTIGSNSYVNYTGNNISTFTAANTTGANQYLYNLNALQIVLGYTNGAWVYIGSDGTNNDGAVNLGSNGTTVLGGSCLYYIYNLRSYNTTLSNTGSYNCYYYEHNYFGANPPTAGTVTHTAGTLVLKANTSNWSMSTWGFTSLTGTRGITFENESYIVTQNTGLLNVNYTSLTSVCPETFTSGFFHSSSGVCSIGPNAPTTPAAAFNLYWDRRCPINNSYVKNLGNWYPRGDYYRIGGGVLANTAAVGVSVSGNILFNGNTFAPNQVQDDAKWVYLNLTYWGADASRTSTYSTGYSEFAEGGAFRAFGPLTLASTFTGTLKLNTTLVALTVLHESGTLDVNGQQLQVTSSYSSTNSSAAKAIISGTDIYTNPSIYIAATSGTPWSFAYSNLLTSNYKIWVYCRGGTVSHGGTSRQTMNQPSFDLTERVSAYTLAPATDFRVSGFRINNYTVPNNSVWSIGGNEFTVYTGGLSAPTNFTVNINKTDSLELVNQLYCDNNSFIWPQVTFNTSAKLITGNWQFKNVSINGNTTVTSPGQSVVVTGTINGVSGSYGPTAILDITGSTWQFTGANPITNDSIAGIEFTVKSNDLTGILDFVGSTGSNTGNQIATFSNGYGGRILNNISYNTGTGVGTLTIATSQYYSAIYGNTTTLIGQLDFGYNTASMAFSGFYDPIRVVGSKFNLGSSPTKYITGAIYNVEASSTISANYLTITNSTVSGGGGWYAGANSVDNGGNSGWYFYAPATFSLARSAATVNEGGSVTITLTTNLPNGTLVPYTITGITSADISGASLTGNFTVSSGTANVVLNIANDFSTEGSETFTLALNNGAASIAVAINDTSLLPTYSLARSAVSVIEGGSFTITLTTTNLPNGVTVPYTITGVSSSDIDNASLTGNFTISGNSASLVVNTTWDYVTEGQETFTLTLNPAYGTGSAISVAINNLLHPTYALAASPTTLNEGGNFTITLTTTDVPDNTTVPYTITGVSTADIAGASLTGNFTVVSNTAVLTITTSDDYLTEGDETFVITLNTIGTTVSVLIADYTKTRTYSLSTSATTVTEGDVFVITLTTTNVFNATTVPYTITGVSTADIAGASLTGNFTITSNSSTQSFTTTADLVAEGSETFTLTLGSPASGSINVSITDPIVAGNKGNFLSFFD